MTIRRLYFSLLLGWLGLAIIASPASAQETEPPLTLKEANHRLAQIQKEIREAQADFTRQRAAAVEHLGEIEAQGKWVRRTVESLREKVAQRENELEKKKAELAQKRESLEQRKELKERLRARMTEYLEGAREAIAAGIPWKIDDRLRTVGQVRDLIESANTPVSSALAAVGRVQQEEEALGRLVETSSLEVDAPTGKVAVQGFHLGHLAIVYASDDSSIIGFVRPGQTLEDGLGQLRTTPVEAAEGYSIAVDVLQRRRTPSIVELYLPFLPVSGETNP